MEAERKLDEKELAMVPEIIILFQQHYTGNENAVTTGRIVARLAAKHLIISGASLRRVIGYIRQNDLLSPAFILSNVSIGYWLSIDEKEMDAFIDKQLNRMTNQFQNVKALHQRIRYPKKTGPAVQPQLF